MISSFVRRVFVVVILAVAMSLGAICQRTQPVADDSPEWTRHSHLAISSSCGSKCRWPTNAGSSLFRLFRGRRAPAAPRFGMDLMMPWLPRIFVLSPRTVVSPPSLNRGTPILHPPAPMPPAVAHSVTAARRGPSKPVPSRIKGTRFATLPARVTVEIYGQDGRLYSMGVPLRPQTSPYDILSQAAARYRDQNTDNTLNPFTVKVETREQDENCLEVSRVGPWEKAADSANGVWEITVSNSKGKVLMSDTCLMSASQRPWPIYPGNVIALRYTSVA